MYPYKHPKGHLRMQQSKLEQLIDLAGQIKARHPNSAVTADAIFARLCASDAKPEPAATDTPEWFLDGLDRLRGKALTVGEFVLWAGKAPMDKAGRNRVGKWLRASGRAPRKTGGRVVFDI